MATHRPLALLAELTYRCPLRCPYCSNPVELGRIREELDTATWKRVLAEAAGLGVVQVFFSGGEPLLRHDLVELVEEAGRLDLYSFLSTGGTLADGELLARLKAAGLNALQISVLAAEPATNDRLAGARSFDRKERAVRAARELGLHVTLNVVVHRQNLDRVEQLIGLADRWQVQKLELAHVQYTGWAFRNRLALLPGPDQLRRAEAAVEDARARLAGRLEILHVLPDYFQDFPKVCLNGWGRVFLTVAPDGAVLPCQTAREIPGLDFPNVRNASLEDIWMDAPVFRRFRGTDWMPEPCRSCSRREIDFGGCRCQAYLIAGDPAATDPVCRLSPLHHRVENALEEARRSHAPLEYRSFNPGPISPSS